MGRDKKWNKASSPPPPLFLGGKERNLVKQINDEVIEHVIGQQIVYYPVSLKHSEFHPLYGESINKVFTDPIHVYALIDFEDNETNTTNYGIDRRSRITAHFKLKEPKEIFGQIDHKMEIAAECVRARKGTFTVENHRRNKI